MPRLCVGIGWHTSTQLHVCSWVGACIQMHADLQGCGTG